jgi:hypothetical protein
MVLPMMFPIVTGTKLPIRKLSHVNAGKSAGDFPIDHLRCRCNDRGSAPAGNSH